jgi:hypothetical protein
MYRFITVAAATAALAAVLGPAPATAATPETGTYVHEDHFIDEGASAACGFEVRVDVLGEVTYQVFFDAAGEATRVQLHYNVEGEFSANGVTLPEIERAQRFLDLTTGGDREIGLLFQVRLPRGGVVIADVGRLVFDGDGNVTFEAGPHPALAGDFAGLCAALS